MNSIDLEKKLKLYRLSPSEYDRISRLLGRPPVGVEWALFSALWSEHCSYKSSKVHLRKFSYRNASVLESEGENAGIIDLGEGERIAFKMESHNHPSFIEPFQGAATGVGGILRDIFTMGARPIALADFLCFGEPEAPRMRAIMNGVVHGISSYGNCVGVPTITGQTEFDSRYNQNVLVNAMAVGLLTKDMQVAKSKAHGIGNLVVYVGAKTGKDGIHGASMASESFGENSEAKKPNVQIGDPFYEKLLIEACLEIIEKDLVVAMQDMGAAGLTSSSFEMAEKGGIGLTLNLSEVPLRDQTMTPEEILLSESQERMLLICEPSKFAAVHQVFSRWGLDAVKVGVIKEKPTLEILWKSEKIAEVDPRLIVDQAPRYQRPYELKIQNMSERKLGSLVDSLAGERPSLGSVLEAFLKTPKGHKKTWITGQYDQRVGLRTVRDAHQSVGIQRLPSGRGIALAVGCRPGLMKINTRLGAIDSIFYPALQMALKGAKALAVTDCLNFGNPERIEVMSDFVTSVEALAEVSEILDIPVISGNVSFYNETLGESIIPTPATGLVGMRPTVANVPWDQFQTPGQKVYLLKSTQARADFGRSEWEGSIETGKWKDWLSWVLEGSSLFSSSKAIGEGGLIATLWAMSRQGIGIQLLDKLNSGEELLSSKLVPFYEGVVAIDFNQAAGTNLAKFNEWLKKAPVDSQTIELGTTVSDYFIFGTEKVNICDLLKNERNS
ncbi:MAG: phosphoribosylformylglycinamidine synthase subunit PurL [Bdellovibrionales bacterium]|nr:phosphoribosylformylglycinamidine synthase subunit PurL [Bdellovibrionales bacterium]